MENKKEIIGLYGINSYYECGELGTHEELLATFDNKDLAEEYVINSIVQIVERGANEWQNRYEFKNNSLLCGYSNFDIKQMDFPHNPVI